MKTQNHPANASFLEKLEELAARQKNCEIVFFKNGGTVTIQGRMEDIYQKDDLQFLKMDSGLDISVDSIIRVDGTPAKPFC